MNVIVGIPSWLPMDCNRSVRFNALLSLLKQINTLWPWMHICIYAQNWDEFSYAKVLNSFQNVQIKVVTGRPGILKARKELRKWLLSTHGDYFLLFDDDAHIVNKNDAHLKIYDLLKQNPKGWSFSRHHRQGHNPNKYNPFCDSQLNFAFISRYVLEREDFPDVNPEKGEGFEDRIYSMTLYCKYYDTYWEQPFEDLYSDHFHNGGPSTWAKMRKYPWKQMQENTNKIEYSLITQYKPPKIE